jgi:hypothetical protein
VGPSGLEPPTSRLSGVCSNQLSYRPLNLCVSPASSARNLSLGGVKMSSRPSVCFRFTYVKSYIHHTSRGLYTQNRKHKTPEPPSILPHPMAYSSTVLALGIRSIRNASSQGIHDASTEKQSILCNSIIVSFFMSDGITALGISLKGGDPAAPSGTATLLRLSPSHRFRLRRYRYRLRAPSAPMA